MGRFYNLEMAAVLLALIAFVLVAAAVQGRLVELHFPIDPA